MPQNLFRSFSSSQGGGEALPMPWPELEAMGAVFRKGQVAIIGAGPGGGKSALALNYLAACSGTTALYLSPDSDIMTIGTRLIGIKNQRAIRSILRDFDTDKYEQHLEASKQILNVQFSFQTSPSFEDIEDEIEAYEAVHGRYPDMIVLDNIRDVENGNEGDWQRHSATVDKFHNISRDTDSACVLLHHLTGEYEDSDRPPPLSALTGKIGKQARTVLNLFSPDETTLGVVVAKCTNGKKGTVMLQWDKDTQIIT